MTAADRVRALLDDVMDPEIPVLSVTDLGIVRDIAVDGIEVTVDVTPTYTACPAVEVIEDAIAARLRAHGYRGVQVRRLLAPAWSTAWISGRGRARLQQYGIAPPTDDEQPETVPCPHCGAATTALVSAFGSTACKSAWVCHACREPFEHFKCLPAGPGVPCASIIR